ncbi:AraC family transcriptional regulator [Enterococcus alcedinis]|uniref:AraC family transcriptional regulator n=2 Tax=Enterococcus alcedinis TaxID=1274384 RepID=A0A917JEP4_9ENTE|nr:AraC family transcriptional regulator [Enterococcus alcedinis]MBP2101710.1 AraC-like DNA-binding protein [Enterococcus alcedinis]GGI65274.1 AraC family transcriptional regulator [Enterococcus alcedinis]
MDYIIEHFQDGADFSHLINHGPPVELHVHNYYEIYLFMDGNVQFFIDNQSLILKPGDLILIRNDQIHGPKPLGKSMYERYIIHLPRKLIIELSSKKTNLLVCFDPEKKHSLIHLTSPAREKLISLFDQLTAIYKSLDYGEDVLTNSLLTQILVLINQQFFHAPKIVPTNHFSDIIQKMLNYIQENITLDISLTSLEEQFGLSGFHLNRLFKKEVGSTIYQYILLSRISLAKQLLETHSNVTEVCFLSGFNDYANFIRTFKKITGLAPKQYAKQIYEQNKLDR